MGDQSPSLTLAALALRPGVHGDTDFIADPDGQIRIRTMLEAPASRGVLERLRDKTVFLALPSQRATIIALAQLDGIAKRIVLWPHDRLEADIAKTCASAEVDAVITTWPNATRPAGSRLRIEPGTSFRPRRLPTQWVLFTSGTTGNPKMVVHTLNSLAGHLTAPVPVKASAPVWCSFYDIRRYGGLQIMLRALVGGGSLVLADPAETPAGFLARAARAGASHFLGTPSHWRRALMTEARHAISPAYVRLSGEVADQVILDRLAAAYPSATIVHAFASTEAGLAFEVSDRKAGFPASLIDHAAIADIRIVDGALQIRSPRNASGTLRGSLNPLTNASGFVDTGDSVEWRDGRYHIAGRQDGIVNVGGQKVHPEEVEAVLNEHPDVQMSLVRARTNPITGAIVVADIVRRGDGYGAALPDMPAGKGIEDDIRAFCRRRLPPHKVPSSVRCVPSLAFTPAGKLVRPIA